MLQNRLTRTRPFNAEKSIPNRPFDDANRPFLASLSGVRNLSPDANEASLMKRQARIPQLSLIIHQISLIAALMHRSSL